MAEAPINYALTLQVSLQKFIDGLSEPTDDLYEILCLLRRNINKSLELIDSELESATSFFVKKLINKFKTEYPNIGFNLYSEDDLIERNSIEYTKFAISAEIAENARKVYHSNEEPTIENLHKLPLDVLKEIFYEITNSDERFKIYQQTFNPDEDELKSRDYGELENDDLKLMIINYFMNGANEYPCKKCGSLVHKTRHCEN